MRERLPFSNEGAVRAQVCAMGLSLTLGLMVGALAVLPPIAQNPDYHAFHDERAWLGIPNAMNVLSNMPFVLIGWFGLRLMSAERSPQMPAPARAAFTVFFAGLGLTGLGSAYYHWSPDSGTLVWDRLPMAIAFTGLFAGLLADRVSLALGRATLAPLVALGIASVAWWALFDDLRLYIVVQFFPIVAIPVLMWAYRGRHTTDSGLAAALGCYVVAKVVEEADGLVLGFGGLVSGHTLKHLLAAAGGWFVYRMLASDVTARRQTSACS